MTVFMYSQSCGVTGVFPDILISPTALNERLNNPGAGFWPARPYAAACKSVSGSYFGNETSKCFSVIPRLLMFNQAIEYFWCVWV